MIRTEQRQTPHQQASEWYVRLESGQNQPAQQQAFAAWIAADSRHKAAWQAVMTHFVTTAPHLETDFFQEMAEEVYQKTVAPSPRDHSIAGYWKKWWWGGVATAALALFMLGFLFWMAGEDPAVYQTALGEKRTITLADGSAVTLNTDTRLSVLYGPARRQITLQAGQAFFAVAPDKARPFQVDYGRGSVTALGTAFEVYRTATRDDVQVTLLEGTIQIRPEGKDNRLSLKDPMILSTTADQTDNSPRRVSHNATGLSLPQKISRQEAIAWQNDRMMFNDWPLPRVVRELNRYGAQKILIGDAQLKNYRLSGSFQTHDPGAVLKAIEGYFPVRTEKNANGDRVLRVRE